MPPDGSCSTNINLFLSPYMEPFDEKEYREENPDTTSQEMEAAKNDHSKKHYTKIMEAKGMCLACPVLNECSKWVSQQDEDVYGVVAGLTEAERASVHAFEMNPNSSIQNAAFNALYSN